MIWYFKENRIANIEKHQIETPLRTNEARKKNFRR